MIKKPAIPFDATELNSSPRRLLRTALIIAVYLCAFIILDFFTQAFEELPGIVAWYPPSGLGFTLLLVFGARFAPVLAIASLINSFFIYRIPQPPVALFLWAFCISLIYGGTAAFLRRRMRFDWRLRKMRDVTYLIFTAVFVSALLAVFSVLGSALSSNIPRDEVLSAILHWWIGETVGILTVTPFLLIHVMPWLKRFAEGQPDRLSALRSFSRPTLPTIGQASSLMFILYWVFNTSILDQYQPLYLISLPLIWIALHRGLKGITTGIATLNFGVIIALWFFRFDLVHLGELQLLMIVNCIVGLLMGATVTERKEAEAEREQMIVRLREALEQVKQLSGFIPMCAGCKKIRDDKGFWNDVAEYITDHSEALVTHGLCPDCMKKLYPDYVAENDAENRNNE